MQINRTVRLTAITAAIVAIFSTVAVAGTTSAEDAIWSAAKQHRYVFVTFYKNNDSASKTMLADVKSIQGKLANRADFVSVNVADKADRAVVTRYGADRSPMPLTIVVAPNGAVTAGFPRMINKNNISGAFVSDGTAEVIKVLQDGKMAVVCLESSRTNHNSECTATARALKSDSRLGGAVEIVTIDPSNRSESTLMKQWKVDTGSRDAQLVVAAPPGKFIGKFDATASKDTIVASITKAMSGGCCGGGSCGSGGCK